MTVHRPLSITLEEQAALDGHEVTTEWGPETFSIHVEHHDRNFRPYSRFWLPFALVNGQIPDPLDAYVARVIGVYLNYKEARRAPIAEKRRLRAMTSAERAAAYPTAGELAFYLNYPDWEEDDR